MLRLIAAAASAACAVQAANPFAVTVNPDGSYSLSLASWPDMVLASYETAVVITGTYVTSKDGSLTVDTIGSYNGSDAWGTYTATSISWKATVVGSDVLYASIRVYDDVPAVVFEQYFPAGLKTNGTYAQRDGVASVFPSFQPPAAGANIGFMQWLGAFLDNGTGGPKFGTATATAPYAKGLSAGPICWFDKTGSQSVMFSSASNFMSGNVDVDAMGNLQAGVFGSAAAIPAGFRYETVLWYGAGINAAVMTWGAALLQRYSKRAEQPLYDFTNTHLGYNTDHGAYYYYETGTYPDYLTALTAVWEESQTKGIPYRVVLLDSWWYFKGTRDGVKNWTAMPNIFPGGNAGLRNLTATTGWKVTAHNRYWAADTDYATQNGGNWNFYVDTAGSPAGGSMAVPLEQAFWEHLLTTSVQEWGLTTYEQDWLYNLLEGVDLLTADPTAGRTWLLQMNAGAEAAGTTIQLCMSYPRHTLQSVEMSQVSQVRASDDHVPGAGYYHLQWRMGYSSLFAWALAVAPFKDNYFSVQNEPGSSVGNATETSPALQQAISVYSAGPVMPGDGVGYADAVLINRACTASGRLLQPSRAATSIDNQIVNNVFPSASTANGDVYTTYSYVSGWVWDHVLAAAMNTSYSLTTADVAATRADIPARLMGGSSAQRLRLRSSLEEAAAEAVASPSDLGTVAYNTSSWDDSTLKVAPFDATHPIVLAPCDEIDFQLWHTAPVFSNGWAYLGELSKMVPVAAARTVSVEVMATDLLVTVAGQANETVPLTFWNSNTNTATTVTCFIAPSGRATAVMPYATCA